MMKYEEGVQRQANYAEKAILLPQARILWAAQDLDKKLLTVANSF